MGVHGLMSYFLNEGSAIKSHKLRGTRLVFDGNNILYLLYFHSNIAWMFGGEYTAYAAALKRFFENLKLCDLTPFLVFDGCYDLQESKLSTILSRARDRIHTCANLNHNSSGASKSNKNKVGGGKLLPILAWEAMIAVLTELNIDHVTCCEEADAETAALAKAWGCPVVSYDSDFFIFPLEEGFIPTSSLSFHPTKEECTCCPAGFHHYLACTLYRHSHVHLPGLANLDPAFMPLLATLMGNDFVKGVNFNHLFSSLKLPKISSKVPNAGNRRMKRISGLLLWMHRFATPALATESLLLFFKTELRAKLKIKLEHSLAQYAIEDSWILRYMENPSAELIGSTSCNFLPWLSSAVKSSYFSGKLSPFAMNGAYAGRVFLPCVVEDIAEESVYTSSLPLRRLIYKLLVNPEATDKTIIEMKRSQGRLAKDSVIYASDEELASLCYCGASVNQSVDFFMHLAGIDGQSDHLVLNCLPNSSLQSYMIIIKLWLALTHTKLDAILFRERHILAVLLSTFHLLTKFTMDDSPPGYTDRFKKYFVKPTLNNRRRLNIGAIHPYNQLQTCYQNVFQLNAILGEPLHIAPPQHWFCGSLFHNLVDDLQHRKEPMLFIAELLGRRSNLWLLFDKICNYFVTSSFSGTIVNRLHVINSDPVVEDCSDADESEGDVVSQYSDCDRDISESSDEHTDYCDTANPFYLLKVG